MESNGQHQPGSHRRLRVTAEPGRRRVIVACACGRSYAVPTTRTAEPDLLERAQQAHVDGSQLMCRQGCHYGQLADVDHYMDIHQIPLERAGEAFAEYLRGHHGWDGEHRRVDDPEG